MKKMRQHALKKGWYEAWSVVKGDLHSKKGWIIQKFLFCFEERFSLNYHGCLTIFMLSFTKCPILLIYIYLKVNLYPTTYSGQCPEINSKFKYLNFSKTIYSEEDLSDTAHGPNADRSLSTIWWSPPQFSAAEEFPFDQTLSILRNFNRTKFFW